MRCAVSSLRAALCNQSATWKRLIEEYTEISIDHMTPAIQLHLVTPACHLWKSRAEDCPFPDPFWAFYWPGGQVLTRFILENRDVVADKRILDVGSGCGATAIAASMCGAHQVTANDIDDVACTAIEMNCSLNNVENVEINKENLIGGNFNKWDVILVGDMFYDTEFGAALTSWLIKMKECSDKEILVGDPGRHAFKGNSDLEKRVELVHEYPLSSLSQKENIGFTSASVWRFKKVVEK